MIEWAMLFALGAFASGLLALALGAVVVRRTARVTERRVRSMLATRRAEFAIERDEERVRFAVEMRRLEREAGTLRDQATAHRLDADLKEQELFNLRAEVSDREVEVQDLSDRLSRSQGALFDTERRLAETAAALRGAQHSLEAEARRRAAMQQALEETAGLADERRLELMALRAENEDLRNALERLGGRLADLGELRWVSRPAAQLQPVASQFNGQAAGEETSGRVVALRPYQSPEPVDWRPAGPIEPSPEAESIERIAAEIHRIAGEAAADLERIWRVPQISDPRRRQEKANGSAHAAGSGNGSEARQRQKNADVADNDIVTPLRAPNPDGSTPEARFLEALEEIRSLRQAGGANPGE
jgi:hypothetical protein